MSEHQSFSRRQLHIAGAVNALFGGSWWTNARSMFVLSTGRTGTETLARLLGVSREVIALHEPNPQLMPERKRAYHEVYDSPAEFRAIFCEARTKLITAARMRGRVYAETSARMTFFAPIIWKLMPRAKFVHLFRHPADVIRSGMRRGWYDGHAADESRITPVPGSEAHSQWDSWSRFEKICWYWSAYHEFSIKFCDESDHSRILLINSDDLFDPESGKWREVFSLIGVAAPPESQAREALSVRHNAQLQGDFPKLEEWSLEQKQTLERIAGATMAKLGLPSPLEKRLASVESNGE